MRWFARVRQLSRTKPFAAVVCAVLVGGGAIVVLVDGPLFVGVALAIGAVLCAVGVFGGRALAERSRRRGEAQREALLRHPTVHLRDVGQGQHLYDLGVAREASQALAALKLDQGPAPYLPREVDDELRDALRKAVASGGATLIVLTGAARSGKSRTMLEAAADAVDNGLLIAPHDASSLRELAHRGPQPAAADGPLVVWLDDIEPFVTRGDDSLSPRVLEALDAWPRPVLVLATARASFLSGLTEGRIETMILDRAEVHRLRTHLSEGEVARARHRYGGSVASSMSEDGPGLFMTVLAVLIERLMSAASPSEGRAVAWAAVDCQRLGLLRPLPEAWLKDLYRHYLRGPPTEERFARGLEWATSPVFGRVALLSRDGESGGYRPYRHLADHADHEQTPVKPVVRDRVIERYAETGEELFQAGIVALRANARGRAEDAFGRADGRGHCEAALELGHLLETRGDRDRAKACFSRADERGSAEGAVNFGRLLESEPDFAGAAAGYRRADHRGDREGAFRLGVLLDQQGDVVGAETAYRRADARGHLEAALRLGALLERRQDLARAEAAYRRAHELGSSDAGFRLAAVLEQREYRVLGDQPHIDEGDPLGFARVANQLQSLILRSASSTPFTIGIEGSWGRGKSSLMGQLKRRLDARPGRDATTGTHQVRPVEIRTVSFNAWTAEGSDVLEGLIKSVLDAMDPNVLRRTLRNKRLVSALRVPVLILAGWLHLGSLADEVWGRLSVDARTRNEINRLVRDAMERWTATTAGVSPDRLLVVFIDDLDRCSGQSIVKVFEALKLYLDAPGFVFVVGYDDHVVSRAVLEEKQDGQTSGRDYVEKIVQTVFRIPRPSLDQMDDLLQRWLDESKTSALFDKPQRTLLIERNNWNPRRIKRFVNRFILEYRLDDAPETVSPELLIKLLILEAYFPDFARLFDLAGPQNPIQAFLDFLDVRVLIRKNSADPRVQQVFESYGEDPSGEPQEALQRLLQTVPPVFVELVQDSSFISLVKTLTPEEQDLILRRVQRRGELGLRPPLEAVVADDAETPFNRTENGGSTGGAVDARSAAQRGDAEVAEAAYRQSDARGDPDASFNLGVLLEQRGDFEGAEEAFRRSDERGHAGATLNLGVLLEQRGHLSAAEDAYRRAEERGNSGAAFNLGVLLEQRGELTAAEDAYRRADRGGSAAAACSLGELLERRGLLEAAEDAYRRADERGDAGAALNLGILLERRDDLEAAEVAYRRADERGSALAALNLGFLLQQRGDFEGAEGAYRRSEGLAVASKQGDLATQARSALESLSENKSQVAPTGSESSIHSER